MRQKKREEQRENAHNERFRIVNCSRATTSAEDGLESGGGASEGGAAAAKEITILDIEKDCRLGVGTTEAELAQEAQHRQQHQPNTSAEETSAVVGDYVYDLYVPDVGQPELEWSEHFLENMLRFVPMDGEIQMTFSYTYF